MDSTRNQPSKTAARKPKKRWTQSGVQNTKAKTLFKQRNTRVFKSTLISEITQLSEKLRPRNVNHEQKRALVSSVLKKLTGQIAQITTNPKASRVLQLCLQFGTQSEITQILTELTGQFPELSKTKYGKHLVQRMISKCEKEDFDRKLFPVFVKKSVELLKHQYGSEVMSDVYYRSSKHQKHELLLMCYGREIYTSFQGELKEDHENDQSSLKVLCGGMDPFKQASILKKLHQLLSILIEKGLLFNQLVHRLILEFFQIAPSPHVLELASLIAETGDGLLKMVHTYEGAAVAASVVYYTNAHGRKTALRGFKDFVMKTVKDEWGHVVLLMAFRVVDDTQLLKKVFLTQLIKNLKELVQDRYGRTLILDLLHRRCPWYIPKKVEDLLSPREVEGEARSKKDDLTRRKELLLEGSRSLSEALIELCVKETQILLHCRRGCDILVEIARGGDGELIEIEKIKSIHESIIQSCKDPTTLTERISKGAIIQLINFSNHVDSEFAQLFCKRIWSEVFQSNCKDWIESSVKDVLVSLVQCGDPSVSASIKLEISTLLEKEGQTLDQWMERIKEEKTAKKTRLLNWKMSQKRKI